MTQRDAAIAAIIKAAGFAGAIRAPLAGDASRRRYERIQKHGRRAILMDAPPQAESAPCPPQASATERANLGYNAEARLAAGRVDAFITISAKLSAMGLSAPETYAYDVDAGLAVIEDFGDGLYFDLLSAGAEPGPLFDAAVDALASLGAHPAPAWLKYEAASWPMLTYDEVALQAESQLFIDWFLPRRMETPVSDEARQTWRDAWSETFRSLAPAAPVLSLRDYHSPNLMWLPDRKGERRAGLLDFQDALAGHPAYDVVSLLQDARRDVDPRLAASMLDRYMDRAGTVDRNDFRAAFAVLGAQRAAKIAGIFARLHYRDGKDKYLQHLPRVLGYLKRDLEHPALAPVARWLGAVVPEARWSQAA
jgi:hypothetical protein